MGGCMAFDNTPPPPEVIQEDPHPESVVTAVSARLGYFGFSRDYGIWMNAYPKDSDEAKKTIWLWFNKSTIGSNTARIDLENFKRGLKQDDPKKGQVLYTVTLAEQPMFQVFQRYASGGMLDMFFGLFNGGYQDQDDFYYVSHKTHDQKVDFKRNSGSNIDNRHLISKWSLATRATFRDGELGRGAAFQGIPLILEVFSKGTVVTSFASHRTEEGQLEHEKVETEFVDRIEYRLVYNNMVMGQWFVEGDSFAYGGNDLTVNSPFFTTIVEGGWFTRSKFVTTTSPCVDPALALLISHVCATEYSVAEIKNDLKVNAPERPPQMLRGYNQCHNNYGFANCTGSFSMYNR